MGRRPVQFSALVLPLVAALALVGPSGALASTGSAGMPPEGIFESCPLDTEFQLCVERLKLIHDGGFSIVVFPVGGASLRSLSNYAGAAHDLGMSIMWETSSEVWWQQPPTGTGAATEFSSFAGACNCTQNASVLVYMVKWLAALPETYGYYALDDSMLPSGSPGAVPYYIDAVKKLDPQRQVMIGAGDEAQTATYERMPDLIGAEIYPVTTSPLLPVAQNQDIWGGVIQEVNDSQSLADAAHKQSAFILQAFSFGDNLTDGQTVGVCTASDTTAGCYTKLRYPTSLEQLQLRNDVLLNAHPQLILWWSFPGTAGSLSSDASTIYPSGDIAASQWRGLAWAVQQPPPRPFASDPVAHIATPHHRRHHRRHRVRA